VKQAPSPSSDAAQAPAAHTFDPTLSLDVLDSMLLTQSQATQSYSESLPLTAASAASASPSASPSGGPSAAASASSASSSGASAPSRPPTTTMSEVLLRLGSMWQDWDQELAATSAPADAEEQAATTAVPPPLEPSDD
jgi:hypothetical protein